MCVIVRQLCSYVNKGQAVWFGLAWLPAVCENDFYRYDIPFTVVTTRIVMVIITIMIMIMIILLINLHL